MINKTGSRDAHAGIARPDDDPAGASINGPAAAAIADLERRFGDPWDPGNPTGHAAVLAADEAGEMLAAGEQLLDGYRLNAEFVPPELGGRLARLDHLIEVMRVVFRHDPCLGLGYGAGSLVPAVNVWAAGDARQRRRMAEVLLAGGRAVSGYHELAHGNDFARAEFSALPGDDGRLRLNGRKEVIANARRAEAMVIFARTSAAPGSRSHSQLFVEKADLPAGAPVHLPRFHSAGMRGVQLGGLEFRDCPIPADAVLGAPGLGMETALRSFQVTRTALPAMTAGILETGLEVAARFADERVLYGRSLAGMPHIRSILADAFTDLLICDCLGTVTARSVHLLPGETSLYASAAKYFVATLLMDATYALSRVLGAQFYIRDGGYGIFQKHLRDLAPAGFGHTARVACLSTVLPQLPGWPARGGWTTPSHPPGCSTSARTCRRCPSNGCRSARAGVTASAPRSRRPSAPPNWTASCAAWFSSSRPSRPTSNANAPHCRPGTSPSPPGPRRCGWRRGTPRCSRRSPA
ncbi:acyl-CoA dehydrogenase [Streptomyces chiangmaiensis]